MIFMQLCKATCTYICSWRIHEIKKKSPKTNTILSTLRLPIQVLTKLPPPCSTAITPQSHRSIEQLTLFCIMSVFPSLCSIKQPSVFCMMSVFPDFCSDIFLLHIIYNFFCLFCLHYTVINLLYRKFTYKRYLFFTDLLFVVLFSLYSKSNCCHTVHIDIYFTNLLFFYVFY